MPEVPIFNLAMYQEHMESLQTELRKLADCQKALLQHGIQADVQINQKSFEQFVSNTIAVCMESKN
jgi:chromosome condensin MukBEF ATPase and DNA-binding subunit MukB